MSWGWQQHATAVVMILVIMLRIFMSAFDLNKSMKQVAIDVSVESMGLSGIAMILHAGGFW